jgi:peptidoglycan glycosyltransferase
MSHQLQRLGLFFLLAFAFMALAAGYWAVVEQESLLARADNPRRLLLERRYPRGTIYDRNGAVLAESVGTPGNYTRHYPYPPLAPVLGYVSAFYGLAGVEAEADGVLHGDEGYAAWQLKWADILGQRPNGRAVRLTLDLALQTKADEVLGARTGAVVLLDAATGDILALASHPSFDPNTLDENWSTLIADPAAPLLNRATFALYQPGGVLQPFILAAALQTQTSTRNEVFRVGGQPFLFGELTLDCNTNPRRVSLLLSEALQLGCTQPFAELAERLGPRRLEQLLNDLRLLRAPTIGLPTTASQPPSYASEAGALGAGQGSLTFTPLHLALATAALARNGQLPPPRLLQATEAADGSWQAFVASDNAVAAFTPNVAAQVRELMPNGHAAYAVAGREGRTLAWFTGFAPHANARFTIAVVLEDGDLAAAQEIGEALLAEATAP